MKFFQKTWVAVVITLAMVAGAVFIGLNRTDTVPNTPASVGLDTSLSTSRSEGFLLDEADVLSQEEEHQINLYNANWLERYDSLIAVAVVPSASGSLEDYAYERAMAWELAAADAVLVIETSSGSAYFLPGDNYPLTDSQINSYMNTYLYDGVANKEYASGILELFQEVNQYYVDQYGRGYLDNGRDYGYGYQRRKHPLRNYYAGGDSAGNCHRGGQRCGTPPTGSAITAWSTRRCVPAHSVLARPLLRLVPPAVASAAPSSSAKGA